MGARARDMIAVVLLVAIALPLHWWGIRRDLPYTPEADEPFFVEPAMRMAYSGDWNPRWFGFPGSTVIYPLAAGYRAWNAALHGGAWRGEDADLRFRFLATPGEFYLPARALSVAYAIGAVVLVYVVGRQAFGAVTGATAALFALVCPLALDMARQVRSDSAATFFGLLFLCLALRVLERPSTGRQVAAGIAAGLGTASRYFMGITVPLLLAVDALLLARGRATRGSVLAGLVAAPIAFFAVTPYLLLDPESARASLTQQMEWHSAGHLGADNLSPLANLWWYLHSALPSAATPAHAALAVAGVVLVLARREARQIVFVGYAVLFLAAISAIGLHWERWTLPLLPVLWLLAAEILATAAAWLQTHLGLGRVAAGTLVGLAALALSVEPGREVVTMSRLQATPSTRVEAREWLLANVAPDAPLMLESYTAPLRGTRFRAEETFSLADQPLDYYVKRRFRYLLTSSAISGRYDAEPVRYAREIAFYRTLATRATLRREFLPGATRGGPVIRVYELPDAG